MILYLDTSALVKRYFEEPGSMEIVKRCREAALLATSSVAYAEAVSAIYRKGREEGVGEKDLSSLLRTLDREWESFFRLVVNDRLNPLVRRIAPVHQLRGFDAIHLASALVLQARLSEPVVFACFDKKLLSAASHEGLETFPRG